MLNIHGVEVERLFVKGVEVDEFYIYGNKVFSAWKQQNISSVAGDFSISGQFPNYTKAETSNLNDTKHFLLTSVTANKEWSAKIQFSSIEHNGALSDVLLSSVDSATIKTDQRTKSVAYISSNELNDTNWEIICNFSGNYSQAVSLFFNMLTGSSEFWVRLNNLRISYRGI